MLSHLSDNDRVALGHLIDRLYDKRSGEHVLVITQRIHILHALNMRNPLIMVNGVKACVELAQDYLHIADDAGIHLNVLIDLSRVDIQLEYLCIPGKLGSIAGHAVTEPGSHHN